MKTNYTPKQIKYVQNNLLELKRRMKEGKRGNKGKKRGE
jgi:hypothetical protein